MERFSFKSILEDTNKSAYGGIYRRVNDNRIHANVVTGKHNTIVGAADANLILHPVKYTWAQLNEAQNAVVTLFNRYGVHYSDVSIEENRAVIGVDSSNAEIRMMICDEMTRLGIPDDMYRIAEMSRVRFLDEPTESPLEESNASFFQAAQSNSLDTVTIMPGGLLTYRTASGAYKKMASLTFGFMYNGSPFFVGCAHALSNADFSNGVSVYYTPHTGNGYPISWNQITADYNASARVLLGTAALHRLTGNYDFTSIRCTQSGLSFSHTGYNGFSADSVGGSIVVGDSLRICGTTTQYNASFEEGRCTSTQASASVGGTTISNMIKMDVTANTGTSGGPLLVYDSATDSHRLIGMASAQGTNCIYCANINYVINNYNLTIMPEGSILV